MKRITFVAAFSVFLALALFIVTASDVFYDYQFEKNNIYKNIDISRDEMPKVIAHMGDYLIGLDADFAQDININGEVVAVYNQREIAHMKDVRKLYDYFKYFALVVLLLIIVNTYKSKGAERWNYLLKLAKSAVWGMNILIIFLVALAFFDFSAAFVKFHEIFFDNDLWLLNPATDRLIQMLPEIFFRDAALLIVSVALISALLFRILISVLRNKFYKRT